MDRTARPEMCQQCVRIIGCSGGRSSIPAATRLDRSTHDPRPRLVCLFNLAHTTVARRGHRVVVVSLSLT